jgi:hypothetical protein
MQGNSVRVLRLAVVDVDKRRYEKSLPSLGFRDWESGPLNFHWKHGDRFPALEEWGWSGSTEYVYSM